MFQQSSQSLPQSLRQFLPHRILSSAVFIMLVALSTACSSSTPSTANIPAAPSTTRPNNPVTAAPPTVARVTVQYPAMPNNLPQAEVVDITDGDTVEVRLNNEVRKLRLMGINTPESVDPRRPVQCFGRESSARTKAVLLGKTVRLETDPGDSVDQFGRLLRYIWLPDGTLYNLQMIAEGYANEYGAGSSYRYRTLFRETAKRAEQQKVGLWSPQTCGGDYNRNVTPRP